MAKQVEKAQCVEVDLLSLIKAWPSDLRKEIAQWNLADAKVALIEGCSPRVGSAWSSRISMENVALLDHSAATRKRFSS
jgi:hypothetical protein